MKKVVITGVTGGVGRALAYHFSTRNWNVVGVGRDFSALAQLNRELSNFTAIMADISSYEQVDEVFDGIDEIDVLINNAAAFVQKPLEECTLFDINSVINTNLLGTIYVTRRLLRNMKINSRIINISSVAATHGIENQSVYCASKYGLDGFAEALSLELRPKGILITTIYPGGINTPLWNEDNKYPGDVNHLLVAEDIVAEVDAITKLRSTVVKKKVVLYPSNETH